jgi:hypothetical protein
MLAYLPVKMANPQVIADKKTRGNMEIDMVQIHHHGQPFGYKFLKDLRRLWWIIAKKTPFSANKYHFSLCIITMYSSLKHFFARDSMPRVSQWWEV